MLKTEPNPAQGDDTEQLLRTIDERIANRGITGKKAAEMRAKVLDVMKQRTRVQGSQAAAKERGIAQDTARRDAENMVGPSMPPEVKGGTVRKPQGSQGILENLGIGLAQRLPIAAADVLNLVRGGIEASNDPAAAVLPAAGNTLDMVSPGLQGAGGNLANQAVNKLAAPPRSPMLNAVSDTLGQQTGMLRGMGNGPVAGYDAAMGGTPSPFSLPGISRAVGGTVIDMGASMGGGMVGGMMGGPAGAAAGAFAPNMLSQWASGMAETANRIMEENPEMDQREALTRAFGVSGTAAVPAAMLDSLSGAESAVAKVGTNTLGGGLRRTALNVGKSALEETATEPFQSVIQDVGGLAAQPIQGQLPDDAVVQYAKERAAEALVGGIVGGAGAGVAVGYNALANPRGRGPTNAPQTPPTGPTNAPATPQGPAQTPGTALEGAVSSPVSWTDARIAALEQELRITQTPTPGAVSAEPSTVEPTNGEEAQGREGLLNQQTGPTTNEEQTPAPAAGAPRKSLRTAMEKQRAAAFARRSDEQGEPAPKKSKATFEHPGHDWKPRKPVAGDFAPGRRGTMYLTNGEEATVEYGIGEADDLIATHDPNKGYEPIAEGDRNERPYQHPTEGAPSRKTVQDITNLDMPETLVSDDPTPVNGPPQVTKDLRSLGGNARLMGMKLIYQAGGETARHLKALMVTSAERFGIETARVRAMKNPILTRRILDDVGPRGSWSRKLNVGMTTERTNDADAVSRGSMLKQEHLDKIAGLLTDEEDTVRSMMRDKPRAAKLIQTLIESGAMTEADLTKALNKDGSISTEGRNTIEKALLGSAVGDIYAMAQASEATRNKMLRAMGSFAVLRNSEATKASGFDVTGIAAAALDALASMKESGARSFEDLLSQTSMVREVWRDNARAIGLAKSLKADGPIKFAKKMAEVASASGEAKRNAGQGSMFGDALNEDVGVAFDRVFEVESKEDASPSAQSPTDQTRSERARSSPAPIEKQTSEAAEAAPDTRETESSSPTVDAAPALKIGDMDPSVNKMVLQGDTSVEGNVAAAKAVASDFRNLLLSVADTIVLPKMQGPRVKQAVSVQRKVDKFNGKRSPATFSDYLGGRIAIDTPEQAQQVLKELEKRGHKVLESEDMLTKSKPGTSGYRALHAQVMVNDTFSAELEIVPRQIFLVMELSHVWYDVTRVVLDKNATGFSPEVIADAKVLAGRIEQMMNNAYEAFVQNKPGPIVTVEETVAVLPDWALPIIAKAKDISTDLSNDKMREAILASVSKSIAKIRTITRPTDDSKIKARLATYAGSADLPADLNTYTIEGARTLLDFLGVTDDTLAAKWWAVKDREQLAKMIAEYPRGSKAENTIATPHLRDPKWRDEEVRRGLQKQIVRELLSLTQEDDETKVTTGVGGGVPKSGLKSERIAYVLIGGPGAGKSTLVNRISEEHGALYISADTAKRKLPEFEARGVGFVHVESAGIANEAVKAAGDCGVNIVMERTGGKYQDLIDFAMILRPRGYKIRLVLVDVAREEAARRVLSRYTQTGRLVDVTYAFNGVGNNPLRSYNEAIEQGFADGYEAYGNDTGKYEVLHRQGDVREDDRAAGAGVGRTDGSSVQGSDGVGQGSPRGSGRSEPGGSNAPRNGPGDGAGLGSGRSDAQGLKKKPAAPKLTGLTLSDKDNARLSDIFKQLRSSGSTLKAGVDPKDMMLAIEASALIIKGGMATFAAFARFMVSQLGDTIKPRIRQLYQMARYEPGMDTSAMTAEAVVSQMTQADIDAMVADTIPATGGNDDQRDTGDDSGSGRDGRRGESDRPGNPGDADGAEGAPAAGDSMEQRVDGPGQPGGDGASAGVGEARTDSTGDRSRPDTSAEGDSVGSSEDDGYQPRRPEADATPVDPATLAPEDRNHVIAVGDVIAPSGNGAKLTANLKAIRLLKKLEEEDRNPSPAEKKILAAYTGWGWAGEYFNERDPAKYEKFRKQREAIEPHMTEDEKASARRSTTNAHYTATEVVRPMWDLVRRLGFKGGRVLEPAAGVGNFFGLMPEDLAASSKLIGVELDILSGRILGKLYPQADIRVEGFQVSPIANNSIDVAISNVPFGDYQIAARDYKGQLIHDYFFLRALDKVKPGGLVVFITSDGTMNKIKTEVRSKLAEKADLVGAIRLPNNAFEKNAGTQVTTDIIVLRKKDGRQIPLIPWIGTVEIGGKTVPVLDEDKNPVLDADKQPKTQYIPLIINEYFEGRPEMALGKHTLEGTMYGKDDYALVARAKQDTGSMLSKAIETLPANIMSDLAPEHDFGTIKKGSGERDGSYVMRGDDFFRVEGEELKPADWLREKLIGDDWSAPIDAATKAKRIAIAKDWFKLREAAVELSAAERDPDATSADVELARRALKREYEKFKKARGTINRLPRHLAPAFFLEQDPDYYLVASLEVEKVTTTEEVAGKATKGRKVIRGGKVFRQVTEYVPHAILERRMRTPKVMPEKTDTIEDAVSVSMGWHAKIDPQVIGKLMGVSTEEAERQVLMSGRAMRDPATGMMVPREHYLGGNVRAKLAAAKDAALADPTYKANVKALEAVQPKDTVIGDIKFTLSSRWVPTSVVEAFARSHMGAASPRIEYIRSANGYSVALGGTGPNAGRYTIANKNRSLKPADLLTHALNGTKPTIMDNYGTPREPAWRLDAENTKLAEVRVAEMHDAFSTYVRTTKDTVDVVQEDENTRSTNKALAGVGFKMDPGLSTTAMPVPLATQRAFNLAVNNVVPIEYDGSHLALPGMTDTVRRLPHRLSVVARILHEGAAVMAHGVGSGKTFSQIVAAMEMRRLGLARKPMIVVQNSTLGQFATSFLQAYPDAKILVATEKTFSAKNRKRLMAQISLGDFDAVIVTHPQFDKIASTPARVLQYVGAKLEELRDAIAHEEEKRREEGSRFKSATQKQMESRLQKLEAKMQEARMQAEGKQDKNVYFEDMGVDFLLIDEAHAYKRAPIITRKSGVKGIPNDHSAKALNLEMKTQGLQAKQNGRGVVLSTGTPITNTMAEAYVMLKLATPKVLADYDITNFDEFADTFGVPAADVERTWSGGYKVITRFKKFINGHELIKMIRSGFDVKIGNKELGLEVPEIEGGKPQAIIVKQTSASQRVSDWLLEVGAAYESSDPKTRAENSWVPITTMQTGMAASLDPRLVDPEAEDHPDSKVNSAVREIAKIHKETAGIRGTQIIFADRFAPISTARLEAFGGSINGPGGGQSISTPLDVDIADDGDDTDEGSTSADDEAKAQAKAEADAYKNARLNIYKDMKAKLVAAGVDPNEIAIIHEYETAPKKEQLFKDMNNGIVRILLGSTEKAGVGVNVQARLVALHEMDPPRSMTPAMQEQRHGRIIRQGNLFATKGSPEYNPDFKVRMIQYGLEDSMEAGIYQLLENKLKFITQALMGKVIGREFDDPAGEIIMSVMEMKAKLTGDTRVIRFAELQKIIADLELERGGIERQAAEQTTRVDEAESNARGAERMTKSLEADSAAMSKWVATSPATARYELDSATGEDNVKELLTRAYADAAAQWEQAKEKGLSYAVKAKINGWDAEISAYRKESEDTKPSFRVHLASKEGVMFSAGAPKPGHIFAAMRKGVEDVLPGRIAGNRALAQRYRKEAADMRAEVKPEFDPAKAKKLREARQEAAKIELQLQGKWKEPGPFGPVGTPAKAGGFMGWVDSKIESLERSMAEGRASTRQAPRTFGVATRRGAALSPVVYVDAAYLVALKAIRAGVKKGIKLSRIVTETVGAMAKHRPELAGKEKMIRGMARKWLKLGNDEAAIDQVYQDAREQATNPQTRAAQRAANKAAAEARRGKVTELDPKGMRAPKEGLTPRTALAAGLAKSERDTASLMRKMAGQVVAFMKRSMAQGKVAGRAEARVQMERLIWDHTREMARMREVYQARKVAHQAEQRKTARLEATMKLRDDLAALAKALPLPIRGKLIPAITQATTFAGLRRAVNRGLYENAKYQGRTESNKALKLNKHAKGLNDANRLAFVQARTTLLAAKTDLSKATSAKLGDNLASPELQRVLDLAQIISDAKAAMFMAVKAQKDEDDTASYVRNWNAKQIRTNIVAAVQNRANLPQGSTPSRRDVNVLRRIGRKYWNARSLFLEIDNDFEGNGPMFAVYKAMYRARERHLERKHAFVDAMEATVRRHGYADLGTFLAQTSGTLGDAQQKTLTIPLYHVGVGLKPTKVTLGQAMEIYAKDDQTQMWAHKGTPFVFSTDLDGQQYTIPDMTWDEVKLALTPQQRAIVDESKIEYDRQTWDALNNLSKRLRGKYLTKVGRYWGIRRAAAQGTQQGVPPAWRDSIPVLEEAGILQDRTGGNLPIIIGDFGLDILSRADASASIIAKADVVRLARMTVLHPAVRTELNNRMGASTVERIEQIVKGFAGAEEPSKKARWLNALIGNSNRSYTQLWVASWLRNIGSVFRQMGRYSVVDVMKGFASYAASPLATYDTVKKHAPIMRERYAGATGMMAYAVPGQASTSTATMTKAFGATFGQILDAMKKAIQGDGSGAYRSIGSVVKPYKEWLDALAVGNLFDFAAAGAVYHIERARGKSVKKAARIASRRFDEVANTNDELTSTGWQADAKENPVLGLWLTFTSDIAKAQNMLYASARRGKKHFARTAGAVALSIAWSAAVTLGWSSVLGKDINAAGTDAIRRAVNEVVSLAPGGNNFGGPLVNMLSGKKTMNTGLNAPVVNLFETAGRGMLEAIDAIDTRDDERTRAEMLVSAVEKLAAATSQAIGLPAGQYLGAAKTAYKNWTK